MVYRNQLIVFEKLDGKKLLPFFSREYVSVPHAIEDKYYSGFVRKTIRDFDVIAEGFMLLQGDVEKRTIVSLERNLRNEPCLVLQFKYGDDLFLPNATREVAVHYKKSGNELQFKKIKRNKEWEDAVIDNLKSLGLEEKDGFFKPRITRRTDQKNELYDLIDWLNRNLQELKKAGVILEQGKQEKKYFTGDRSLEVKTSASGDWFDVYATVHFGEFSFPFIKLKNHILNDIREFELPNGEVAIIPEEWLSRYKSLIPFARTRNNKMQFGKHHFALVQHILQPENVSFPGNIKKLSEVMQDVPVPKNMNTELRSYQKTGFRWMYSLHMRGFGGCLADDMGLGKTLQTLALLLKLKRKDIKQTMINSYSDDGQLNLFDAPISDVEIQPASLIVLPTSLVHNWESEIKKFTPTLKVYKHVGQQRKSSGEFEKAAFNSDIILTTYGTVRNDVELMARLNFFYLILDESQYVKNPFSKTYKAIMKLHSEHRMALTGTPIENSLSDLWSQMNFLNKGMLGNLAFFRRYFITPIEKHHNADSGEKLQILIQPFVLRRTKDEVEKDLPPLMEQVILCEMEEFQHRVYEKEKSIIRNSILAGIEQDGVKNSSIIILRGLTKLRQLANHPKMLDDIEETESGKFEEIFRMLENVVAEKHKVLIFSSFVKHLELLRMRIEKENWKYSMLTGKTSNRGEIIRQFQDEVENRIFLISLKAGGVGLNLTSADYVFIIDPWWNPASENQAISRAHRIGQNKHVFVYRFITQGSIEEKIQQLQSRKSTLANKFINSNNPLQEITKEEITELFK
jgi:SNF2 family DNA or RNA helicase